MTEGSCALRPFTGHSAQASWAPELQMHSTLPKQEDGEIWSTGLMSDDRRNYFLFFKGEYDMMLVFKKFLSFKDTH